MRRIFLLFLLQLIPLLSIAQQDLQLSFYMFNKMYNNPAASGIDADNYEGKIFYRNQWLGWDPSFDDKGYGAPITQVMSLSAPLRKINSGIGLVFVNDQLGAIKNQELQLSYAYHQKIGEGKLSIGIRSGLQTIKLQGDLYRYNDSNDEVIDELEANSGQVRSIPNLMAGISYTSEKVYVGVGFNHLYETGYKFSSNLELNKLTKHLNLVYGMNFDLSSTTTLNPNIIIKTDFNTLSYEVGALAKHQERFFYGVSYRDWDAIIGMAGVNLLKDNSLTLGYSFGYVVGGKKAKAGTSHEIMLSYRLPIPPPTLPKVIYSPRFRIK